MKKLGIIATLILLSFGVVFTSAAAQNQETEETKEVKLTEEQKNELAKLYDEAFEKKKEIITKYVEYGVFTVEKGDKLIEHIESHYKKLEENNYIPKYGNHKHHHDKGKQ
ncbi:YckD family protein [Mesobacillus maritimus]|uniref:YckD family protein n=1 Tax=Mesobacillus maritimus TaxID=1643336 RepID=A0ABS7KAV0_9BACI|nr:YckD family protein [Mesobacillus maritimus]MBY0099371.1 YckD family protein [Mesobacillus maritimus]